MAVRSCVAGGAGAPGGHRITGDPTRGCRGAPVGACARGPLARAMIAAGLAQGDSAALIARRIGRCRQTVSREIRRGAGVGRGLPPRGGTGRGPGALGPPQDPQAGRRPGPARAGRRPARGIGAGPRQIAARLRFENPDDESMRPCSRADPPGPVRPGRRRPARPVAGGEGPAHRTHPPHTSAPRWPDCPSPGARSRIRGATHRSAPAPGATRGPSPGTGRET